MSFRNLLGAVLVVAAFVNAPETGGLSLLGLVSSIPMTFETSKKSNRRARGK